MDLNRKCEMETKRSAPQTANTNKGVDKKEKRKNGPHFSKVQWRRRGRQIERARKRGSGDEDTIIRQWTRNFGIIEK